MKSLIAHHFLIVDTDVAFACELALAIKEAGGESSIVSSGLQAISCLKSFGADVVLCGSLGIADTTMLKSWFEANRDKNTKFIQLFTTPSQHQLFASLSYQSTSEIIEQLPQYLFGMEDFFKVLIQDAEPKAITYKLKLPENSLSLDPLEVNAEGIYFSTEHSFAFDDVKALKISFNQANKTKSFDLPGVMEYHSKGGPFFRIHPNYQFQWDIVLHNFENKQEDISGFLKKAAGF